ncbi:MAG: bifunctional N-acetylglucosamine-1-phosphate uridyltransferase/glucosamine-1-phosphate acetyltransferase [Planctomycetes bacterium]|nr:bifunctional N-acetylglucosamine-1-phosphate uridyltransferase/glucosamine-1-phosphate acetyltransferase [Planctomycetota bacterium]
MARPDTVIILAAGQGTRMKTGWAKVMAPLCGQPMIAWVVAQALALEPRRILVVVGYRGDEVAAAVANLDPQGRIVTVVQAEQKGTGHAVQCCLPELGPDPGRVVLLYGDMPLLRTESLELLCTEQAATHDGVALLTASPSDPRGFGRIVRAADGSVARIVEEKDASSGERTIREVNLGVYAFDGKFLVHALPRLEANNAQREYYVTDVVAQFARDGRKALPVELGDVSEAIGVNTLVHLAEARAALQRRILEGHMLAGVFIEDPATTYIAHGVKIGAGTHIAPCSVIDRGCVIGAGCRIGPFAHLGERTTLDDGAEIGNFTETKRAHLGKKSKAKHLAYIGDAELGERVNVGAGTVFANYDGKHKHTTRVADHSFLGCGTVLVAPCSVGAGATTGANAVVTRGTQVGAGELWVGVPAKSKGRKNAGSA